MSWGEKGSTECDLALTQRHAAPTTAEQLLFLLESVDDIDGDKPKTVAH